MLLGTLGASLLGNLLTGRGIERVGSGCHSKKEKELKELVMVIIQKIKWIFNKASSFDKL